MPLGWETQDVVTLEQGDCAAGYLADWLNAWLPSIPALADLLSAAVVLPAGAGSGVDPGFPLVGDRRSLSVLGLLNSVIRTGDSVIVARPGGAGRPLTFTCERLQDYERDICQGFPPPGTRID
jgi:hypothetical protein